MDFAPLFAAIVADYNRFMPLDGSNDKFRIEQRKKFADELSVEVGKKYIRVVCESKTSPRVWGFIVNCHDDKSYPYGTILKAASWKAPARNGARGNIITGDLSWVRWTGLAYK